MIRGRSRVNSCCGPLLLTRALRPRGVARASAARHRPSISFSPIIMAHTKNASPSPFLLQGGCPGRGSDPCYARTPTLMHALPDSTGNYERALVLAKQGYLPVAMLPGLKVPAEKGWQTW